MQRSLPFAGDGKNKGGSGVSPLETEQVSPLEIKRQDATSTTKRQDAASTQFHCFEGEGENLVEKIEYKTIAVINSRLSRVAIGNVGDVKNVGDKVWELRINYGPGYRIYFTWHGSEMIILLAGGDKDTQSKDIAKAQKMAQEVE